MRLKAIAAAVVLAAAVAGTGVAIADEIPFIHGYKVERLRTYDVDGRAVGYIDVEALPRTARPVAWGETLIGIRAKDGRVVFVRREDVVIGETLRLTL